ncbi:MAG: MFS transporter [Tannerellaceae bacterium]|nr:MFS transporter [Tannerellaceae bacterium]
MKIANYSKDFILVAVGQIISVFGNQILRYALPLYLLNQTGSSALFGTIMASAFLPMLVLFPVGGIIADRLNKKNMMVLLDFCTALLIISFCLLEGKIDLVPLMAITLMFLSGIQGGYQPVVQASIPVLVDEEHLMQGNSIINLINSLSGMLGPVMGGILFSVAGLPPILYVSIACFSVSALMEMWIRIPFEKKPSKGNIIAIGWGDLKESFHFLFRERPVLWQISLLFASLGLLLTSLVVIGLPVLVTQHLGFTPDTANRLYGYAQGVMAAGAILGGLLAGILSGKLSLRTVPFLLSGCALAVLPGGITLQIQADSRLVYLLLTTGGGVLVALSTIFQIQVMSYLQKLPPQHLTGKVISCFMCVCMCTLPLGQLLYGVIFEQTGNYPYIPFYIAPFLLIGITLLARHIFKKITDQL